MGNAFPCSCAPLDLGGRGEHECHRGVGWLQRLIHKRFVPLKRVSGLDSARSYCRVFLYLRRIFLVLPGS